MECFGIKAVVRATFALVLFIAVPLSSPGRAAADSTTKKDAVTDEDISAAVENQLRRDKSVPSNDIEVSTQAGVVTLVGSVSNLLSRDNAHHIAQTVRGVRAVINRLEVKPPWGTSDSRLQKEVESALTYDPAADAYELKVSVKNGVVTLNGQVQSFAERDVADKVARGVRGVRDVQNAILVHYKQQRSDSEIKADVDARLKWDALLDQTSITSAVSEGKIALSGSVGSDAERARAYLDAWVAGAKSVDTAQLKVEPWLKPRMKIRQRMNDTEIQSALSAALLYDPRVSSFNVLARSKGGVVTLHGTVDNLKAKRAAVEDARSTHSVIRVIDRLHVKASAQSDDNIAKGIREAFGRDPYVERFEILVSVHDGTVYLRGTVDSFWEKMRADQIASTAQGVKDVRNNLTVYDDRSPLVYEPRIYDFYPYEYIWYTNEPFTYRTDVEIKSDIEGEMFWSPFVDANQVKVRVDGGVATLEGKVDTYSEMYAAVSNAYEGGAIAVHNRLRVD